MKRIILSAILGLAAIGASAQIEKFVTEGR